MTLFLFCYLRWCLIFFFIWIIPLFILCTKQFKIQTQVPLRDWKKTPIILQFFIIKSIVPDWIILMIRLMKSYSIMFIKQYLTNLDSTDTAKCHNLSPRIGSSVFIITTQCSTKTKGKNMKFSNQCENLTERTHWWNQLKHYDQMVPTSSTENLLGKFRSPYVS